MYPQKIRFIEEPEKGFYPPPSVCLCLLWLGFGALAGILHTEELLLEQRILEAGSRR